RADICPYGHDKNVTGWSGRGCAECGRLSSANYARRKRGAGMLPKARIRPTFSRAARALGLFGAKRIPEIYLRGSRRQRLALLQGLMDTDGCISPRGRCEFVTTNEAIADGFAELVVSLGLKFTRS